MQDLTNVLSDLARSPTAGPSPQEVEGDLRRGRRALRRRRVQRGFGGAVVAIAMAGSFTYLGTQPTHPSQSAKGAHSSGPPTVPGDSIRLVAYHGKQLPGFTTVALIPQGWKLQASTEQHLVIAPAADNTSDDAFTGKLVVSLTVPCISAETGPETCVVEVGTAVSVNGQPGAIHVESGIQMLTYRDGDRIVSVQSTPDLGWTNDQLVSFAEGLHVNANAVPVKGLTPHTIHALPVRPAGRAGCLVGRGCRARSWRCDDVVLRTDAGL